jgi:RecA-family ATPase
MKNFTAVGDYLEQRSSLVWIVDRILPVGGKLLLYSEPKAGKSFHALDLCRAVIGETPDWLGFAIHHTGPVAYLQLDTARPVWQERLHTLVRLGWRCPHLYIGDRESLDTWPFDILRPDHASILSSMVATIKPVMVVIDVLKETNRLDENNNTDQQIVVSALEAAIKPAALVLVAHARKPLNETKPDILADIRGASYLAGAADTIMRPTKRGEQGTMYYVGRAIEGGMVHCERVEGGTWKRVEQAPEVVHG